jgi:D-arabinitol dehydrogenase (NADP+)
MWPPYRKALRYSKPEDYAVVEVPLPTMRENDIMVQGDRPVLLLHG